MKFTPRRISRILLIVSGIFVTFLIARQQLTEKPQNDDSYDVGQSLDGVWDECVSLIQGNQSKATSQQTSLRDNDEQILQAYSLERCNFIIKKHFPHPPPSDAELDFPIAFTISVYKSAQLLERLLQAIYMPQNFYCIHVDLKSPPTFLAAVSEMIRCLPNVVLTDKRVDIIYPHISILHAQFNCMGDLLRLGNWKYLVNLVGQDFPLYDNHEIVYALKGLNGKNAIESFYRPDLTRYRTEYAFKFEPKSDGSDHKRYVPRRTKMKKSPPPFKIKLFKGANHVALTREFVEYILSSRTARAFIEWLSDTISSPETFYASLQQHPRVPGGIVGRQPAFMLRAINWENDGKPDYECHGKIIRRICWIDVRDLKWALGRRMCDKLFVQKIPFDFNEDLLRCLLASRQHRKYKTFLFT